MELITVIVPVFNKSNYLDCTIKQILGQTYQNIELICIDDNSTDDSLDKLNQLAKTDSRMTVLHNKERMGAANTRNIGFDICKGKYIIFLDADDQYANDLLESAYRKIQYYNADVVVIPFERINICKLTEITDKIYYSNEEDCVCPKDYRANFLSKGNVVVWNKLYRTDYLVRHGIRFQNLSSNNDVHFSVVSLCLAEKIAWIKEEKSYIKHMLGIENQISNDRKSMNAYLAWKKTYDVLKQYNIWDSFEEEILYLTVRSVKQELRKCNDEDMNREVFERMQHDFCQDFGIESDFSNIYNANLVDELNHIKKLSYDEYMVRISFYRLLEKYCSNQMLDVIGKARKYGEIVVWGAGLRAWEFINFLDEHGVTVRYVIDRDNNKHAKKEEINIEICSWAKIKKKASCVCVLRDKYYADICKEIGDIGDKTTIVNVEKYAPFYVEY